MKRKAKTEPTDRWLARLRKRAVEHEVAMQEYRTPPPWVIYRFHRDHGVIVNRRNPLSERDGG